MPEEKFSPRQKAALAYTAGVLNAHTAVQIEKVNKTYNKTIAEIDAAESKALGLESSHAN